MFNGNLNLEKLIKYNLILCVILLMIYYEKVHLYSWFFIFVFI